MSSIKSVKITQALPHFPIFKKVTLSDRKAYNNFYKQFEPYSDFSFNNLWVWFNHSGGLALSVHEDNIIVRLDDPFNGGASEYSVLGKRQCAKTFHRVLRWQKAMGLEQEIVMIPEEVIRHIHTRTPDFKIAEDPDNHDYVYDVEEMFKAVGRRYAHYRRDTAKFSRLYGADVGCRDIDIGDLRQCVNLVNHIHRWGSTYRQDQQSLVEGIALNAYLQDAVELDARCFGIFIKDELVSFVIYHLAPQGNYGMFNHMKCNYEFKHISDYTMQSFVKKLHKLHLQFVNFEQDLGIPGLRHYKQSLRPSRLLKRFTIVTM